MKTTNPFHDLAQRVRRGDERAASLLRRDMTLALQRLVRCALTIPALDTRFARMVRRQANALAARSDVLFSAESLALVLARLHCEQLIASLQPSNTQTRTFEDTWCEILHPREEQPCNRPFLGA